MNIAIAPDRKEFADISRRCSSVIKQNTSTYGEEARSKVKVRRATTYPIRLFVDGSDLLPTSTEEAHALLFARLDLVLGMCRQLEHSRWLAFAQQRQQDGAPIWKFERVVMCGQLLLVNLTEDGCLMIGRLSPTGRAGRQARDFAGERQLGARQQAHCHSEIL
jgi:hypothetical protein